MNWKFNYLVISLFTDCPLESIPRDSVKSSDLLLDSRELHYSHLKLNSVTQTQVKANHSSQFLLKVICISSYKYEGSVTDKERVKYCYILIYNI